MGFVRRKSSKTEWPAGLSALDTKRGQLQHAVWVLLMEHQRRSELPTSVRYLFYELEQKGILSKTLVERTDGKRGRRADQDLQDAVLYLREKGIVPWDWIEDETRVLHDWECAASVADYVLDSLRYASINPWLGVRRPLILCESRTVVGILARTIGPQYRCPVAATNGQAHGFLVTKIAPLIVAEDLRVLYVGDFDLAGSQIEANTREVLERHVGEEFDEDRWERVALIAEQVEGLKRRGVKPIGKVDKRYLKGDPRRHQMAFEVEALTQSVVTRLLRERLDAVLPEPLERVLEREERQKRRVQRKLKGLKP